MRVDFCASAIVLHPRENKVLLVFHRKLQKWLQVGGHIDPGELPHEAVLREVHEETGLVCEFAAEWYDTYIDNLGALPLPIAQFKQMVPAYGDEPKHIHHDSWYVLRAPSSEVVTDDHGVLDAHWFGRDEILTLGEQTFPSVIQVIEKIL